MFCVLFSQYFYMQLINFAKFHSFGANNSLNLDVSITESIHFYNGRCFTFTPLIAMPTTGEEFGYRILLNREVELDSAKKKYGWNIYIHEIGEQWTGKNNQN